MEKKSNITRISRLLMPVIVVLGFADAVAADPLVWGSPNQGGLNIGWGPYYLALEKGYFKDEGIDDLDVISFNGTGALLPQVVSKEVLIGSPNADIPIISQQPGRDAMPLTFFYNLMRSSVWQIVVPESSDIKTLADLEGKTIGVGGMTWANVPTTTAMLHEAGLEVGDDVSLLAVGVGGPAFQALNRGEIDALNLYDTAHVQLELSGTKLRRLELPGIYTDLFSTGFVTNSDNIENQSERLIGFGRAMTKGIIGCFENLEFCVRAYWAGNPASKPSADKEAEALAENIQILKARGESYLSFSEGESQMFGSYPDSAFSDYVDILYAQGTINTKDIPVDKLFTNKFVEAFNDFDKEALRQEARSWK